MNVQQRINAQGGMMQRRTLRALVTIIAVALVLAASFASAAGCTGTGNCYWVGGTGSSNSTAHWATTDGGATTGGNPSAADNCNFTANSSTANAAYTFTVAAILPCKDFVMAGPGGGNKVTWAGSSLVQIAGNFNLSGGTAGITNSHIGGLTFNGNGTTQTMNSNGVTITPAINVNVGAYLQNTSALSAGSATLTLNNGTWDPNGKVISLATVSSSNTNTRSILCGTSVISLFGGTPIDFTTSTNLTLTCPNGTWKIANSGVSGKTLFLGNGLNFGKMWITASSNVIYSLRPTSGGSATFPTFLVDTPPKTIEFQSNTTINLPNSNSWQVNGASAGSKITVWALTPHSNTTIAGPAGTFVCSNFIAIQDMTWTGQTLYAVSSTNNGGTSGVIFGGCGPGISGARPFNESGAGEGQSAARPFNGL